MNLPVPVDPPNEETTRLARLLDNRYAPDANGKRRRAGKLTPPLKRKFCEAIASGASVTKAAQALGLARTTFHYQRAIDPEFAEAWQDALERFADRCEDRIEAIIAESSHPTLPIFQLKHLRPDKWGDKPEIVRPSVTVNVALPAGPGMELLEIVQRGLAAGRTMLPPGERE